MVCPICNSHSNRLQFVNGKWSCHICGGFSELGGPKIDGILTRNSFRVRSQQSKYAPDFVQPHFYDKTTKQMTINPDFVKLYPNQVKNYFTEQEIAKAGMPKLSKYIGGQKKWEETERARVKSEGVQFTGNTKKAISKVVKS